MWPAVARILLPLFLIVRFLSPSCPRLVAFLGACVVLLVGAPASAGTIDFNILLPPSGLIFYDGSGGPLTGSNIGVDTVRGTGTPDNAGTYACIGCRLDFQTGNFLTGNSTGWIFGGANPTSFISVSGMIDTDGDSVGDLPLLMVGDFIGPQLVVDLFTVGPFDAGLTVGIFVDVKNPALTDFFGMPSSPYVGGLALGWIGFADPPGAILARATRGVVRNTVPEPSTSVLLVLGLAGLGAPRRDRLSRTRPRA